MYTVIYFFFRIFIYLVYGISMGSNSNATINTTLPIITTLNSDNSALGYSTNGSSDNLTSFVLSNMNSLDGMHISFNDSTLSENYSLSCSSGLLCNDLPAGCMDCDMHNDCIYGRKTEATCVVKENAICNGERKFTKIYECRYCYQSPTKFHICTNNTSCRANVYPQQRFISNCSVPDNMLCLGNRNFLKMRDCNWTSGKRWRTAIFLSITLGGLGAERFYLGQWREGLGKLFSFGGLGVWTLVDVVLVATGYLTPADGSLYI